MSYGDSSQNQASQSTQTGPVTVGGLTIYPREKKTQAQAAAEWLPLALLGVGVLVAVAMLKRRG